MISPAVPFRPVISPQSFYRNIERRKAYEIVLCQFETSDPANLKAMAHLMIMPQDAAGVAYGRRNRFKVACGKSRASIAETEVVVRRIDLGYENAVGRGYTRLGSQERRNSA